MIEQIASQMGHWLEGKKEGTRVYQCRKCWHLTESDAQEDVCRCSECGSEAWAIDLPRHYAWGSGTQGVRYLHLTHPAPVTLPNGDIIRPKPAQAVFMGEFVVWRDMSNYAYNGTESSLLDARGYIQCLIPHLQSGKVIDVTYGDPADARQQAERARKEELRQRHLTQLENVRLKQELLRRDGRKEEAKALNPQITHLARQVLTCPWCGWLAAKQTQSGTAVSFSQRLLRLDAHMKRCRYKPTEAALVEAAQERMQAAEFAVPKAIRTPSGDQIDTTKMGEIPEEFQEEVSPVPPV